MTLYHTFYFESLWGGTDIAAVMQVEQAHTDLRSINLVFVPRLKVSLDSPEPRVHFALVCGAKSCPPIKTYSSDVSTMQRASQEKEVLL